MISSEERSIGMQDFRAARRWNLVLLPCLGMLAWVYFALTKS